MSNIRTVSQINNYIKKVIENDFLLKKVVVEGEVSNLTRHSMGHYFFTLKDDKSEISAVMFYAEKNSSAKLIDNGKKIIVKGKLNVYERGGKYNIIVEAIEENGLGIAYKNFLQLKEELQKEGYLELNRKKDIPKYCLRIGIVTADASAALADMCKVSLSRNPYARLYLYPALVQGILAKNSLVKAIQFMDKLNFDVIVVGRGGGSYEDLMAFNEKEVAYAIINATTPIVSAVGHESDITIADLVADLRVPTPTAAMNTIVVRYSDIKLSLMDRLDKIYSLIDSRIKEYFFKIYEVENRLLKNNPMVMVQNKKLELNKLKNIMDNLIEKNIINKLNQIRDITRKLQAYNPATRLDLELQALSSRKDVLDTLIINIVNKWKFKKNDYIHSLEKLSPLEKISQGYLFASKDGEAVKDTKKLKVGDNIKLYSSEEELLVEIKEKCVLNMD